MNKTLKQKNNQNGFTLIEVSIVMLILGIFTVAAIQTYKIYDEKRKFETTELRLTDVENAINDFVEVNGRLPCAAPRGVDRTNSKYGREEDCKTAPSGTVAVMGRNSQRVRIGMLPARTLGISDIYMQDAYGNSLVYAVTEGLADEASYAHDGGGIDVLDNTRTSRLSAVDYAQYILVSPGNAGYGAYSYAGQQSVPCDEDRMEGENCNDDAVFMDTDLSRGDVANFYDDRVLYKSRLNVVLGQDAPPACEQITGAFIYGDTCPEGWEMDNSVSQPRIPIFPSAGDTGRPDGSGGGNVGYANQAKYFHMDEETGEYALTDGYIPRPDEATPPTTVFGTRGPYPKEIEVIYSEGRNVYCKKKENNTAQTKCFTEKIITNNSCPSGFVKTGSTYIGANQPVQNAYASSSASGTATLYEPILSTVCGRL